MRPTIADEVEDYVIIAIDSFTSAFGLTPWYGGEGELACILRGERTMLSDQEIANAMSCRISFSREDAALIDWHQGDGRCAGRLGIRNVELLEMRILDEQLDLALDEGYEVLIPTPGRMPALPSSYEADATHIASCRAMPPHLQQDVEPRVDQAHGSVRMDHYCLDCRLHRCVYPSRRPLTIDHELGHGTSRHTHWGISVWTWSNTGCTYNS